MKFLALTLACPECGSHDVVYSCDPDCCFNHVCSACHTSFELFTRELGEVLPTVDVQPEERDSCAPTVACARCHSLNVYMIGNDILSNQKLACASCHAVLKLELFNVTPG